MTHTAIDLLCQLIGTPSVNPRLARPSDGVAGEAGLLRRLIEFSADAGWAWATQPVHAGRSNLITLIPGDRGDAMLWDVHVDTVSGDGMTSPPFTAVIQDGRVYGRGACDVKGAMAAMLTALRRAACEPASRRPAIILSCTVNEECGFTGARALADIWRPELASSTPPPSLCAEGGLTLDRLRELRPRVALIAEPTELNVVVSHRGVVRWKCAVHGRACHSSRPDDGVNAIYGMTRVVELIADYHRNELSRRSVDPLCGPPTACVTTIAGGTGPNTVPDLVVIDVDRRLTPDESPQAAFAQLTAYLAEHAALAGARIVHEPPWMESYGLRSDANRGWAEQVAVVARSLGVASELQGVPYGANAASIAAAGIPTVIFGPGSIAQAHTADEWIAREQLQLAEEAYFRIACGAVGLQ